MKYFTILKKNVIFIKIAFEHLDVYLNLNNRFLKNATTSGLTTTSALRKKDDSVDLKATLASAFHYCASHSLVLPLPQSEDGNEDFARLGSMLNFDCICLVRVLNKDYPEPK